ncbi:MULTISPECIES: VOC family protein [unclassified Mesorhizobium]|uniref:VOC family protein n=1 Tax=unclassified Mesorhizobium TaxID=325217 RepID=UPI000FCBB88D|nr:MULTISPECIES: VOC family protein [unclassified Mesorhizobium]RUX00230.1 VOC family protein [Mesorhizobium sp. M8A.F.Ca.ET.059.01.1.1]RVD51481.1 VOC family protein [Mesorhizobium sp. M8A.F.Ca.ET.023.02.2.1]RWC76768.1 MAG: VOC family protein [Mesorhizobium sp.]TGR42593.1 VOC family protein [bacterium M00.F.Ca.ET.199.01.1.1]TGU30237.1 VOC family protein [bacterium M00.F.Ca.ET.156.01.1.1]TGV12113.1 VOC family protein [Mesorhizobium sp. M8A.F.Ca.ET.173.01.1.1]TGV52522.1 VOC family protein [bac
MDIQGIYAALATTNMAASERFYTLLFERRPDDRPMDSLIQWRGVAGANIQIFLNESNAGSSMCTIVVPNMDKARASLERVGLTLGKEKAGDFGRVAHIRDPDGNQLTLAEPPGATQAR